VLNVGPGPPPFAEHRRVSVAPNRDPGGAYIEHLFHSGEIRPEEQIRREAAQQRTLPCGPAMWLGCKHGD
jgi:hypothetical protein